MSFQLDHVVPWGRNMDEYRSMFVLSDEDMKKKIADFGGGPSAFNCEATARGGIVTSFDPIYQFTREDLQNRIEETRTEVMRQMEENRDNYVWTQIKSLEDLEQTRMSAMEMFLEDYERGRAQGRYRFHELPASLPVRDQTFDIGLSSHFLLMYDGLGLDFHIRAITEMLRVCKEVRIFPIVDLDAKPSEMTANIIKYFQTSWFVELRDTSYEFQKGGNRMLRIAKKQ